MKTIPSLITLTTICFSVSCQNKQGLTDNIPSPAATEEEHACCSAQPAPPAVASVTSDSIYQLDSDWQDANGKKRQLKSLGGYVQVVTMGYTTCQYACPRLLADMRQIEQSLSKDTRAKTHFTFISIDPDKDTPERLAEYRKESKMTPDRWTTLTSDTASVQELAVVLGVQYRKSSEKDFAHSNVITVLNANGEIIHRQEGLGSDQEATVKVIENLSRGQR